MSTPFEVISASFDRLATSTSINDKIGSLRTIKSLSTNNISDVIPHITDLFELLKDQNKDLLSLVVECLFNLLSKDPSLNVVFGKYVDSFYLLLQFKHTPVLFHALNILLELNPDILYDNIKADTISSLIECFENDVLVGVALETLLILSLHPPIQYQLLFQGIDPLMDLAWQCLHSEPIPLTTCLGIILNMLKHPKGLELIQDAYLNNLLKQFNTCWMGLVNLLVKEEYSLPNKVIQSMHYFEQFAIKQKLEHDQFSASLSKGNTVNDNLTSFWVIPHEEWMEWDDSLHLYCKILIMLKPSSNILQTTIEIATTWGVPLQTRAYAWRLLKHLNTSDILEMKCRVLFNKSFQELPVWQVGFWFLVYLNASTSLLLLKVSITETIHFYEKEEFFIYLMSPQIEHNTHFHPLLMAFLNGKEAGLIWPVANLLWNTKHLELIFKMYKQRANEELPFSLLKILILLGKSFNLLASCSYWVVLSKWFTLEPTLIYDWFQDPRALNFMSECMSSGDIYKQAIASFTYSIAVKELLSVNDKSLEYCKKTLYPVILNRIGLEPFLNKLQQLENNTHVFHWENIPEMSKLALLPEWSKFIASQLQQTVRALRAGPEHAIDAPEVLQKYKHISQTQESEILALKAKIAEMEKHGNIENRTLMLEDKIAQLTRKYDALEAEQEDLLVCLAEQELEMKNMAERLVQLGDAKYQYLLEEQALSSPESSLKVSAPSSPIKTAVFEPSPGKSSKSDSPLKSSKSSSYESQLNSPTEAPPVEPIQLVATLEIDPKLQPEAPIPAAKSSDKPINWGSESPKNTIKAAFQSSKELVKDASELFGGFVEEAKDFLEDKNVPKNEKIKEKPNSLGSPTKEVVISNSGFMI